MKAFQRKASSFAETLCSERLHLLLLKNFDSFESFSASQKGEKCAAGMHSTLNLYDYEV